MPGPEGEAIETDEPGVTSAPVAVVVPAEPAGPDIPVVSNSGMNRYKPCVLCLRVISVFDTSAGCQDPSIGAAKGCDRLAAVEADPATSGTEVESPAASSEEAVTTPPAPTASQSPLSELEDAVKKLEETA